jgi:hypothetical protein
MAVKNPRFKCPDGHRSVVRATGLPSEKKEFDKLWCNECQRFFYVDRSTEERLFACEIKMEFKPEKE